MISTEEGHICRPLLDQGIFADHLERAEIFIWRSGDDFHEGAAETCGKDHQLAMVVVERRTFLSKE